MSFNFNVVLNGTKSFLTAITNTVLPVRLGHQTCTHNRHRVGQRYNKKRRGIKANEGTIVRPNQIVVYQRTLKFHPGMNVGFGRKGHLFAMVDGVVKVSCEKFQPNWDHSWVIGNYGERKGQTMYKKYFNVIPKKQHGRFKLIDSV